MADYQPVDHIPSNIDPAAVQAARAQWVTGDYAGAWQTLAQAGDRYADNATMVLRYIEGNGIQKSIEQGVYYLKKSALRGNKGAQIYLSGLFIKGEVVKQDYDEASKWLALIKE